MKILVTGGFGYLGGRLVRHLTADCTHEIFVGTRGQEQLSSNTKIVRTIWNSSIELRKICSDLDTVIHVAGMNAHDCAQDSALALEINGLNTARLLQAAVLEKVKRFIYISTAHVYANPLIGKMTEETCAKNLHPYASSHRAGEDVVRAAHHRGDIEGIVIRLANTYGAPSHYQVNCWTLLVNDICRQAVMNQKIKLNSSGSQQINLISMADACRAIAYMLELPSNHLRDGLFNIGGARSWTVIEMATFVSERAERILGKKVEIFAPIYAKNENSEELNYDVSKFLKTGFEPSKEIAAETEVNNLIQFCLEHFNRS